MNFLGANNQENVIFGYSPNNEIRFSDFTFVTKGSYGRNWFNGTNESNYGGMGDKLIDSNWEANFGITALYLFFNNIKINGTLYDGGEATIFTATDYADYTFRNDGYGLGFVSYIDQLNIILQTYQLRTRFYPALGNQVIGIINTAENFEVNLTEFAENLDVQTDYSLKCEYGNVYDSFAGPGNYDSEWA